MIKTSKEKDSKATPEDTYTVPEDVQKRLRNHDYSRKEIQLPLYPELTRILPNHIARTPLFAPIKRGKRTIYDREKLASRDDVEIHYSGKQLDMADQDVFLQTLELFRDKDVNDRNITVNRASLLKAINRATGKQNYKWLEEVMHRLKTGTLTITTKRYKTELSLIDEWMRDEETGQFMIAVNPKIKMLFSNNEFGYINWPKRMAIEKKIGLAKWLQSYISASNKGPQRHKFTTIKNLCGSKARINDFRVDAEEALKELVRVGEISNLSIDKIGFDLTK